MEEPACCVDRGPATRRCESADAVIVSTPESGAGQAQRCPGPEGERTIRTAASVFVVGKMNAVNCSLLASRAKLDIGRADAARQTGMAD